MVLTAVIEIPANTTYKYEIDKNTGELVLDRPLSLFVPFNYGYVPKTLCDDGDPLDIFVISSSQIFPKTRVQAQVIGAFRCKDNGPADDKLVAVLVGEEHLHTEIEYIKNFITHYLTNYKQGFEVISYEDAFVADGIYNDSVKLLQNKILKET